MSHTAKVVADGWIDPQTGLEYASEESARGGKDPIPHWRNARIKHFQSLGHSQARTCQYAAFLVGRYDRQGTPKVSETQKRDRFFAVFASFDADAILDADLYCP